MLCVAAMAVTLFGCKPDSGNVNSKAALSNSSAESTAEVSSETESSAENDSTDSSIESDVTVSEEAKSEPEYDALPEVIETLQICELDDDGNYVPLESVVTARKPDRMFLAINGEIGNWPVKWSSSDDMYLNIDQFGMITFRHHGDNPKVIDKSYNVVITASLPTGNSTLVTLANGNMSAYWGIIFESAEAPEGIKYWQLDEPMEYKLVNGSSCSNLVIPLTDKTFQLVGRALFVKKQHFEVPTDSEINSETTLPTIHFTPAPDNIDENGDYYAFEEIADVNKLNITWVSSDPTVATVDKNGLVTIHNKGRTLITATVKDEVGGKRYSNQEWLDYMYINVE